MRRLLSLTIIAAATAVLPNSAYADGGPGLPNGRYNWASPHAPGTAAAGGWTTGETMAAQHHGSSRAVGHAPIGGWSSVGNRQWRQGNHVRFRRGHFVPSFWVQPRFFVSNWGGYGFPAPGLGRNWIRYYDDALLVDRGGYVHDERYGVDWERYEHGPVPEYAPGGDEDDLFYADEGVTWGGGRRAGPAPLAYPTQPYALPYPAAGESRVYHVPPGAIVTITAPVETKVTTTRTYWEEVPRGGKPHRTWRGKGRRSGK